VSQSASQAHAFYRDVAKSRTMWTVRKGDIFASVQKPNGTTAVPFWSTLSRVQKIIKTVPVYSGGEPVEVPWDEFLSKWIPDLRKNQWLIGVNWSGKHATGYDLEPDWVLTCVNAVEHESSNKEPDATR
jgi:hypothetical protein